MKKKKYILLLLFTGLFFSCWHYKDISRDKKNMRIKKNKIITGIPPGTIQLDSNIFCDKTDMKSDDYYEYMWWTARVFSKESKKNKRTLPNDSIIGVNVYDSTRFYLTQSKFREEINPNGWLPVISISYQQALDYSRWRSDRVFEYKLIVNKILKFNPDQDSSSYFSIEKYFNNQYIGYKPDSAISYPEYTILSIEDMKNIKLKSARLTDDSIDFTKHAWRGLRMSCKWEKYNAH
jgi:hypothetical protein